MTYTYGKGSIHKHCYDVFMRTHPTDAQISTFKYAPRSSLFKTYYQLFALAQLKNSMLSEIDIAWTDGNEGHKVLTRNSWYNINTSGGAISIDFRDVTADNVIGESGPPATGNALQYEPVRYGQVGSVIAFEVTDATYAVTITDSYGTAVVLENVGDIVVFYCDDTNTWSDDATFADMDEWILWFFAAEGSLGSPECHYYTKIGACETGPTIKTAEGEVVSLADCTDKILSETAEVVINDLNVSKDNYEFLRGIDFNETNVDVFFMNTGQDYVNVVLNPELIGTYVAGVAPNWVEHRGNATEEAAGSPEGDQCQAISNEAELSGLVYQNVPVSKNSKVRVEFWARNSKGAGGKLNLHSYGRSLAAADITITDDAWRKYYTEFICEDNDMILGFYATTHAVNDTNEIEFCDVYLYTHAPNSKFVEDVVPQVNLEVTGNDMNKVTITCKKEVSQITSTDLMLYNNVVPSASRETVAGEGIPEV